MHYSGQAAECSVGEIIQHMLRIKGLLNIFVVLCVAISLNACKTRDRQEVKENGVDMELQYLSINIEHIDSLYRANI